MEQKIPWAMITAIGGGALAGLCLAHFTSSSFSPHLFSKKAFFGTKNRYEVSPFDMKKIRASLMDSKKKKIRPKGNAKSWENKYEVYFKEDKDDLSNHLDIEANNSEEAARKFALMAHKKWGATETHDDIWEDNMAIIVVDEHGHHYEYETEIDMDPTFYFTKVKEWTE